ncbi:tripartite tricarboxylate transporter substrate binding protein [Acetobacteraceae bacterium H6797]|nr:tripartite tricarboxylate transporter substrate binding protein [Acetobacteraceae bacterium H6797]
MSFTRRSLLAAPAAAALLPLARPALAQSWPDRPVTLIVPYPPGGAVDGVARMLAQELSEKLKANVVVDNRAGGAGGSVGVGQVMRSRGDGYTLLFNASIHVVQPLINKNVTYDPVNDFTHIGLVADGPLIVSTSPNVPAKTLKEFFDLVKKDPAKYNFCTSGYGSAGHLAVEQLKIMAGVDNEVITYRGAGPALTDLAGGTVQLMADPFLSSLPLVKGGQIKALAVTSKERSPLAPEIPTVAESGMEPFDIASWYAVWAPKDMPAALQATIAGNVNAVVRSDSFKNRLAPLGFVPKASTPEELKAFVISETARYKKIVETAKISVE